MKGLKGEIARRPLKEKKKGKGEKISERERQEHFPICDVKKTGRKIAGPINGSPK